jgi:hypothetical protein
MADWMALDFVSLFCAKDLFNTPVSDVCPASALSTGGGPNP